MSRVCVIPDMHGSSAWEAVHSLKFDYSVSLGDWFDNPDISTIQQIKNFKRYMEWVKIDPEHRFTCIGNHDLAYLDEYPYQEISGHDAVHHEEISHLLMSNIKFLRPYVKIENCVFSHAGVSAFWLASNHMNGIEDLDIPYWWKSPALQFDLRGYDPSGNDVTQGPLWIRPEALLYSSFYPLQCIGHTEICKDNYLYVCNEDESKRIIFCDSPTHDLVQIIDLKLIEKRKFISC